MHQYAKFYLILLHLLMLSTAIAADNNEQVSAELEAVNTAIDEIQGWLVDANERQSVEEQNLRAAEQELAEVSQSTATIEQALDQTRAELNSLQRRSAILANSKTEQSAVLAQAIRATYMTGQQSVVKLLLNQEDISKSARMLHYSRVFSESQLTKIEAFQDTLDEMSVVNNELEIRLGDLDRQQNELNRMMLALTVAKSTREHAIADLNQSITTRNSELQQLENNQAELQELIEEIASAMEQVRSVTDLPPFTDQRGKLPLPADGPVISRFGSRYGDGNLTRQGITVGVDVGTPVQAVHSGRIVFSDWLRGTGWLVIVDHGGGYMSLYGSNLSLSKQAGDWVNAGDILASSGTGGDRNAPGIYFEIRYHGEAQNPSSWIDAGN